MKDIFIKVEDKINLFLNRYEHASMNSEVGI